MAGNNEMTVTVQMVDKATEEVTFFLQDTFRGVDQATLTKIVTDAIYDMRMQLIQLKKKEVKHGE